MKVIIAALLLVSLTACSQQVSLKDEAWKKNVYESEGREGVAESGAAQ